MRLPAPQTALALALLLGLSCMMALTLGAIKIPAQQAMLASSDVIFNTAFSQLEPVQQIIIGELRLPRMLLALFIGALLAQCGAVMQGLFRNPLADPGIIGVSSGAAVGAVLAIVVLPASISSWSVPVAAFISGLATTLLVYRLAKGHNGTSVVMLLLSGVAIAAFSGALIGFLSYFTSDSKLRELSLWQMGSLANANFHYVSLAAVCWAGVAIYFQRQATALNALLLGESEARHLGIAVEKLKLKLIVVTAVAVGIAVACSGVIGFIGLLIPHLIRMLCGPDHHKLLPLCALAGALLLLCADVLARLIVAPAELPIGLVTALLGAPFFLSLLIQQKRRWQ